VVPLQIRFADLMERYGRTPEARGRIAATAARTRALEEKLFAPLRLSPLDLLPADDHGLQLSNVGMKNR
jgi:hypothetical protein